MGEPMITVAGEALIDLIVDQAGHVDPRMGGGPFNVARAVARLGQPVDLPRPPVRRPLRPADARRPGAQRRADRRGRPVRRAHHAGPGGRGPGRRARPTTSTWPRPRRPPSARPRRSCPPAPRPCTSAPSAWSWSRSGPASSRPGRRCPEDVMVMLDPNCRPGAIPSRQAYLDRLGRILRRADVVKVSTEDLAYLFPGQDAGRRRRRTCSGQGPACVLVTDGADTRARVHRREEDPGRCPRRPGRRHRGRRRLVRRGVPRLVDRQRPRPGRPGRTRNWSARPPRRPSTPRW